MPPAITCLLFALLACCSCCWSSTMASVAQAQATTTTTSDPCAGRRVHVRRLPSRFNTDLLRHCATAFPLADPGSAPACASLANHGLGPRTHNRSRSWYRTDARLLEPLFPRRLLDRRACLVRRPAQADAVFLPYYAALDALDPALLNSSALHGLPLARFLARDHPHLLARRHGHDHFFVLAGPAWDFSQPLGDAKMYGTTSLLSRPELANFTILTLQSRAWP
ncbi:hypothetical protein C2845_PM02G40400 [Panicum miliaceum]|uniref:Exostosin GT47 domain-containing protein n=1 Tax=Panicum miliaceum TaxID=4540 RepID=A0A3L6SBY5_PANMI|nr:hypothetical protein C2845_PM02G40400 [Panicum miliaceum]